MDNIILIASGVLVVAVVALLWTIIKIKQSGPADEGDEDEDLDAGEKLIKLSPPKLNLPRQEQIAPVLTASTPQREFAQPDSLIKIEKRLEVIEESIRGLHGLINQTQTAAKAGGEQILKELKAVIAGIPSKANDGTQASFEILGLVKTISKKISELENNAGTKTIGLDLLGENANSDTLIQKIAEIQQLLVSSKDGEEEILTQIINKLDILNRIITSHITKV